VTPAIDLEGSGLGEWEDPATAGQSTAESQMRLQAGIIAARLLLQNMLWEEKDRAARRQIEVHLAELHKTGVLLASLLNAGKAW
jgi:hypothetical protein